MINDKMAKMAVNTLKAYCDQRQCGNCAVNHSCDLAHGTFKAGYSHSRQSLPGLFHRGPPKGSRPRKWDSIVAHVGNAKYC